MPSNLVVRATMASPFIPGAGYMTLDGILGAVLFDQLQDVEAAHAAIPVTCQDGLFLASAADYTGARYSQSFCAGLHAAHSLDPELIRKNKSGRMHRGLDTTVTNVMNSYAVVYAPTIEWQVQGDALAIARLLTPIQFIGKRRTAGFGEVAAWSVEAVTDAHPRYALEDEYGYPLRPIPADLFQGDRTLPMMDAAWKPAYWNIANRTLCFAP